MNTPPIFTVCAADATVQAIFSDPSGLRVYPFEYTEQNGFSIPLPYCVWQTVGGNPENNLSGKPKEDNVRLQVDIYGQNVETVRAGANAIEGAIDLYSYVTSYMTESFEKETKIYRASFGVEWIVKR